MAGKIVSIEIGQQVTRICEVDYKKKNPHVYNCVSFETPKDVIEDGFICDINGLAELLKEKMEQAGIKNQKVVFSIASTKIANREVTIPEVKKNRIRDIVLANASDYFPIDIEEYNITYVVLEKVQEEEHKQLRLLVLAAPDDLIKTYYELADKMHVQIVGTDYAGNSSYQITKLQGYTGVNLIVQMNDQNTLINLMEGDTLLLQRTLPYGTNTMAQAIINTGKFGVITYKEALQLVAEEPILTPQFIENYAEYAAYAKDYKKSEHEIDRQEAQEEITNSLKLLLSNINRVIDYFTTQHPGKAIDQIQIIGDSAYIQNLDVLIMNEIGIPTTKPDHLIGVAFVKAAASEYAVQNHYASCIGAAMAPTDFAPRELAKKGAAANSMRFPLMMLGLCAFGAVVIIFSSILTYKLAGKERTKLKKQVEKIADIEGIYNDYQDSKKSLATLTEIDAQTQNKSEEMTKILEQLEQKTPNGCVIHSMQYSDGTLNLQVTANNKALCAEYIKMLKTIDTFGSVTTSGYSEEDSSVKNGPVTFTAVCTFQ